MRLRIQKSAGKVANMVGGPLDVHKVQGAPQQPIFLAKWDDADGGVIRRLIGDGFDGSDEAEQN